MIKLQPQNLFMEAKNVEITNDVNINLTAFLKEKSYSSVALLCDENTYEHCLPLIIDSLPEHWLIQIESGEENKNIDTCQQIWRAFTEGNFDRNSLLINLGGGVIGDMGGFAASTYKRGIDFINIPTTLLAQVDASVGGKLGIDFMGFKNHIGLFKEPEVIIIDSSFFNTLPAVEVRSGFAEVIKHGLITDQKYWESIADFELKNADWSDIVEQSVEIKKNVVRQDPFESGLRKILNFGHTIGHGIESTYLDHPEGRLLHGEAIAKGMICEAFLSTKKTGLSKRALDLISNYLLKIFGHEKIDENLFENIIKLIYQDKKNSGKVINTSLLQSIGKCVVNIPVGEPDIIDSLFYYNSLENTTK
ncbi:MAG: 3-dehydroquinate synthase [Cyclobacteriaceae bacterium]